MNVWVTFKLYSEKFTEPFISDNVPIHMQVGVTASVSVWCLHTYVCMYVCKVVVMLPMLCCSRCWCWLHMYNWMRIYCDQYICMYVCTCDRGIIDDHLLAPQPPTDQQKNKKRENTQKISRNAASLIIHQKFTCTHTQPHAHAYVYMYKRERHLERSHKHRERERERWA